MKEFGSPMGLYRLPLDEQLMVLALYQAPEDAPGRPPAPTSTPGHPPAAAPPPPPGWRLDEWQKLNRHRVA